MSTTDLQPRDSHVRNRTNRRARRGCAVDNTPLVDIAFLLLTFFMFATTMAQPQTLEMRMPPSLYLPVVPKRAMTIYLREDGRLFYRPERWSRVLPLEPSAVHAAVSEYEKVEGSVVAIHVASEVRHQKLIDLLDAVKSNKSISIEQLTPNEQKEVGAL